MSPAAATITAQRLAGIAVDPDLAATVSRDDLSAALRWATGGMGWGAHTLPVLRSALLHVTNGALHVTTFDYEQSAAMSVPAAGGSGHALVPAQALVSFLHVMPRKADVRLTVVDKRLVMQAGDDLEMSLPTLPVAEWPAPPEPGDVLVKTTGERLAQLARACCASGRDDSLPVLTSVHIESRDGKIVAASTDRYRLAVSTIKGRFPAKTAPLNVPAKALRRLGSAFASDTEVVVHLNREPSGRFGGDTVTFVSGSRVFATRLIEGEFPKYRSLMEHAVVADLTVPTEAMRTAARQAAVAVRGTPIVLHLKHKTVMSVTGGIYGHATGEPAVTAKVRGITYPGSPADERQIGVNDKFFTDGLSAVGGETAVFHLGPRDKPLTIANPDDDTFSYLLMPVRLAE